MTLMFLMFLMKAHGLSPGFAQRAATAMVMFSLFIPLGLAGSWAPCARAATQPPAGWAGTALAGATQDLNQATRAEIEAVRGVGVELTERLLQARAQGHFVDWADLRRRVKGLSRRAMEGFAEAGFRIRGQAPP